MSADLLPHLKLDLYYGLDYIVAHFNIKVLPRHPFRVCYYSSPDNTNIVYFTLWTASSPKDSHIRSIAGDIRNLLDRLESRYSKSKFNIRNDVSDSDLYTSYRFVLDISTDASVRI